MPTSDVDASAAEQGRRAAITRSRALTLRVNLAKLLVLATAVPAAAVGIAQRAVELAGPEGEAVLVGLVGALGSLTAILGSLALGRAADSRGASERGRWLVVLVASLIGVIGVAWMAVLSSAWELAASWMVVQLGCSGASAVLRVLLTHALPSQRRRGATAMVVFTYIGAGLPLLVLFVLPGQVWSSAVVFGLLSVTATVVGLLRSRRADPHDDAPEGTESDESRLSSSASPPASAPDTGRVVLPWALLVSTQLAFHLVMSAYLAYHALDVAARFDGTAAMGWGESTVRTSVLALMAGLLGLFATAGYLLIRPATLIRALPLLATTGIALAASIAMRGLTDSVPVLMLSILLSGAAVGLSSSLLLTAALESGPRSRAGGRIGVYSAATAVGQLLGPLLGLAVISALGGYQPLYLVLGTVPVAWAAWAFMAYRRGRHR